VNQLFPHWGKRERGILKSGNGKGGFEKRKRERGSVIIKMKKK